MRAGECCTNPWATFSLCRFFSRCSLSVMLIRWDCRKRYCSPLVQAEHCSLVLIRCGGGSRKERLSTCRSNCWMLGVHKTACYRQFPFLHGAGGPPPFGLLANERAAGRVDSDQAVHAAHLYSKEVRKRGTLVTIVLRLNQIRSDHSEWLPTRWVTAVTHSNQSRTQ